VYLFGRVWLLNTGRQVSGIANRVHKVTAGVDGRDDLLHYFIEKVTCCRRTDSLLMRATDASHS
jgi:hypothetical protein